MGDPRERGPLPRFPGQPGGPHPAPRHARLPDVRQSGLLPGVRASIAAPCWAVRSRRACSRATRPHRWHPAARCASSATRRRSRPPAGPRWFEWEEHAVAGQRNRRPRGAMPRPRHHRAAARRGRADGGAHAGGGRQPRQVAFPGGHEPRDPHADERHPRHDVAARRHRALARAAHLRPRHRALGAHAADPDRRDPRLLQDRGRQAAAQLAPLAIDECVQGVVELLAPKAYEKGIDIAWAVDPALPRPLLGRRGARAPDRHQPRRQRHQVHRHAAAFSSPSGAHARASGRWPRATSTSPSRSRIPA